MELHELQVGGARPRPQRQREPVAGGLLGIRGRPVQLAETAGRQHDRAGPDDTGRGVRSGQHAHAAHLAGRRGERVDGDVVFEHGQPLGRDFQAPLHLRSRGVAARPDDPEGAVPALAGAGEPSGGVGVEPGTAPQQAVHGIGPRADDRADRRGVAEPPAGGERVGHVRVERVVPARSLVGQHDRHTALRPPRVAVGQPSLGHHQRAQPEFHGSHRGREPGDPAADHHHVGVRIPRGFRLLVGNRGRHSPPPGVPISTIRRTEARALAATSGSTSTSSTPPRSDRSNAAGVIIFM